jgi:hypothetical protein
MSKAYKTDGYCEVCDKFTQMIMYDSQHERDSSADWQLCLECKSEYSGMTGEWEPDNNGNFDNTISLFESGYYDRL